MRFHDGVTGFLLPATLRCRERPRGRVPLRDLVSREEEIGFQKIRLQSVSHLIPSPCEGGGLGLGWDYS